MNNKSLIGSNGTNRRYSLGDVLDDSRQMVDLAGSGKTADVICLYDKIMGYIKNGSDEKTFGLNLKAHSHTFEDALYAAINGGCFETVGALISRGVCLPDTYRTLTHDRRMQSIMTYLAKQRLLHFQP